MEDRDSVLLRKLEENFGKMSDSVTRMSAMLEEWAPTWRRQGDGLVDLVNRQTKQEGRHDLLQQQFEADKKYRETLESVAAKASEERKEQARALKEQADQAKADAEKAETLRREHFRWFVGAATGIAALLLTILGFLFSHFQFK